MTLITGYETAMRAPGSLAPLVGTGTGHAVHDDFPVQALCGVPIIVTDSTAWPSSSHPHCPECALAATG